MTDDEPLCEMPGCTRSVHYSPGVFSSPEWCTFHLYTLDE